MTAKFSINMNRMERFYCFIIIITNIMKFTTLFAIASIAIAAPTAQYDFPTEIVPGKNFVLVTSGGSLNGRDIKKVDSHPHVFSVGGDDGVTVFLNLNSDGSLCDANTGRAIYLDPNTGEFGYVDPWGQQAPTKGFTIDCDKGLCYNGCCTWRGCPSAPDKYSFTLSTYNCIGGTNFDTKIAYPI